MKLVRLGGLGVRIVLKKVRGSIPTVITNKNMITEVNRPPEDESRANCRNVYQLHPRQCTTSNIQFTLCRMNLLITKFVILQIHLIWIYSIIVNYSTARKSCLCVFKYHMNVYRQRGVR
jgi:hypothetical protein